MLRAFKFFIFLVLVFNLLGVNSIAWALLPEPDDPIIIPVPPPQPPPDGGVTDPVPPKSSECCDIDIPIPMPVYSNFETGQVIVWSGDDSKKGQVHVYNTGPSDALWVQCNGMDAVCMQYGQLDSEVEALVKNIYKIEDIINESWQKLTTFCPIWLKIAGVTLADDGKTVIAQEPTGSINEAVCQRVISNYRDFRREVGSAVRREVAESFENTEALMPEKAMSYIKSFIFGDSYKDAPDFFRLPEWLYAKYQGIIVQPRTTLASFYEYTTRGRATLWESKTIMNYVEKEEAESLQAADQEAEHGRGQFGRYNPSETVAGIDGEEKVGRMRSVLPAAVAADDLQAVRKMIPEFFSSAWNYPAGTVQSMIEAQVDPAVDLAFSGLPAQRDLLNSILTPTGPGIFRFSTAGSAPKYASGAAGGSGGQFGGVAVGGTTEGRSCTLTPLTNAMTLGLNEQGSFSFQVSAQNNGNPEPLSSLQAITVTVSPTLASLTSFINPAALSSIHNYDATIQTGNTGGNATMTITATFKSTTPGQPCSGTIMLTVLDFVRYECYSQRCASVTGILNPYAPNYICVGTADDGNNNDCTPMGSNCRQEWCVDINDADNDGFNAACYDSCPLLQQNSCKARGFICEATTTGALFDGPRTASLPQKLFSAVVKAFKF